MQKTFYKLLRFGYQKVGSMTFISKLHKRNMESFSLCNADKTHEAWKPLLNTIHAFRGLSECLHNETCNISFVQSASINLNADLLTPESYYKKTRRPKSSRKNLILRGIPLYQKNPELFLLFDFLKKFPRIFLCHALHFLFCNSF